MSEEGWSASGFNGAQDGMRNGDRRVKENESLAEGRIWREGRAEEMEGLKLRET